MKYLITILLALSLTGCASTTCLAEGDAWNKENLVYMRRVAVHARPHLTKAFYPEYVRVSEKIADLARQERVKQCRRDRQPKPKVLQRLRRGPDPLKK